MMSHQETRQRKTNALNMIFDVVRGRNTRVKLNDLYSFVSDIWNTNAYFIQDAKKNVPVDIDFHSRKKGGTFVVVHGTPKFTTKELVMGGLFPKIYHGKFTTSTSYHDDMKKLSSKEYPKMFDSLRSETVALYRKTKTGEPTTYMQVTDNGKWLFSQDK